MSDDDYVVMVGGLPCHELSVQRIQMQVIIMCVCAVPSIGSILSSNSLFIVQIILISAMIFFHSLLTDQL